MQLPDTEAWQALAQTKPKSYTGAGLFTLGGVEVDVTRQCVDDAVLAALRVLAAQENIVDAAQKMAAGAVVNTSEHRAATHMQLRDLQNADTQKLHAAMQGVCARVMAMGRKIRHIIHVGMGGSIYGVKLVAEACGPGVNPPYTLHFVSNADAHSLQHVMQACDPRASIVVLASKSFKTLETIENAKRLRAWLQDDTRIFAATANARDAQDFGVYPANILTFPETVGGRFSVWSSVGITLALYLGWDAFAEFLAGAALADGHYLSSPTAHNIPHMLALLTLWNRNFRGLTGHVVVPYSDALAGLPVYLQQLEMESLGKSVDVHGQTVSYRTGYPVYGLAGTDAQHSFMQCLHQGTDIQTLDFIGVRGGNDPFDDLLRRNLLAQSAALWHGDQGNGDVFRRCAGHVAHTIFWLSAMTPRNLGTLLALQEHKVHALATLWRINPFDQPGVELGKTLLAQV